MRLEADALSKMNVGQRLKLLEEKIISFTRDLMHFDHFAIRLLDRFPVLRRIPGRLIGLGIGRHRVRSPYDPKRANN